jgi:cysteine desulfurase / selenocysteine lyase
MKNLRSDFPMLHKKIDGNPLIYLDNAATSQKPQAVIDALTNFYTEHNSNIHRAIYALGEETTTLYENARKKVAEFINADPREIIFTKGTTESINFVASTWAQQHIEKGDEILISQMEHHSNMIPWQQCALRNQATLQYIPITSEGILVYEKLPSLISQKTKLVAVTHVSNVLGTRNDIEQIIKSAHSVGARVLIDAAQSAPHEPIDVKKLKCDFLIFSGHKMLGPTGIGVLYIKKDLHDQMPPYQFGGGMVYEADLYSASWQKAPHKFEAGTPPIAAAIGLAAAIDYIQKNISFDELQKHEAALCEQLIEGLSSLKKIKIVGPVQELKKSGHLVSFVIDGMHPHDIAAQLSRKGICVRAGTHCAQPLAKLLHIPGSVRASFYLYNTQKEVEQLIQAIKQLV